MIQGESAHDGAALEAAGSAEAERRLPPITELAVGAMILVVIGGIYLAAHIPGNTPLAPAVALLAGAAVLVLAAVLALSRVRPFAWRSFWTVFGWALLAYLVIAGMIEYAFIADGTRGGPLVVLSLMLAVYAVDIPLILGFSVARYQPVEPVADV
ncbi:MAG TPA: hypothetical protein VH916_06030 [Dehalococcoidia bacterium]